MSYYAVHRGRVPGVYTSWPECQKQINRFENAKYMKFQSREEAEEFAKTGNVLIPPHYVYCDGSCDLAADAAGAGLFYGTNDPRNAALPVPGKQTNQRAELFAVLTALRNIPSNAIYTTTIVTDSLYSIKAAKKEQAAQANLDLITDIWKEMARLGKSVELKHVRGHRGIFGNEQADILADQAMDKVRQQKFKK